jgi:hypothetical protein
MREWLGEPRENYTTEYQPVTNPALLRRMVSVDVGPFRARGLDAFIRVLTDVFEEVQRDLPELYALIGTAGILCPRLVRGSKTRVSDHAWGTAVDLTIGGELDARGDNSVQAGLLSLYPYFHKHGLYWGAEYPTEDAMHFCMSAELIHRLMAEESTHKQTPTSAPVPAVAVVVGSKHIPARMIDGRLYAPARDIVEALGRTGNYNISTGNYEVIP